MPSSANTHSPITLRSFPRAILHIDGDAFFTSVEQALHPALRGKPVVTGKERGIIACASYEAKALGIKRGISLWDARKICPDLVVVPSDYETYSLMSKRMFAIMRRFTPEVEEYSIDEGFADITGMRSYFRKSYPQIACDLQQTIQRELDLTVSIGLSLTKSLAKIASDYRKPQGLTAVPGHRIHEFLPRIPTADIWGLGRNRVALLAKFGIHTAWDYISRPEPWIRKQLHKPGVEIWQELRGTPVMPLNQDPQRPETTISKTKTFSAPSDDPDFVYAKLLRNLESACIKLRRHHLRAQEVYISLRTKDYHERSTGGRLNRTFQDVHDVTPVIRVLFQQLYQPGTTYRTTGIILTRLSDDHQYQYSLFENPLHVERMRALGKTTDLIQTRYGKHTIHLGTGCYINTAPAHERDTPVWRKQHRLPGETTRKHIRLPLLNLTV